MRFASSMAFESVCITQVVRLLNNQSCLFSNCSIKELAYEELFSFGSYVQESIFSLVLDINFCRIFDIKLDSNR
ncbi:hypothetical protein VCRA2113O415_170039 [Vibrio crassostreae]|nr:hypothetical protein VCRA2111O408_10068 [Vibrio crassostreae]CAK2316605.1 hypothetical protein VCRA211O406_10804 [Vibrio crassostreae]CAK2420706.1 hypothetical protein VCRA2113O415_170039 [Vibrio crassostreae]CAK2770083.1 hypothetical protein VCRA2113O420_20265 [Vibrio crassostreae]CAK3131794.1 hypothetical protein VCRA2123O443_10012 [Vibrio crassostreae]